MKSDASHDPSGKSTGKEVIVKVTNTVSRKVREQRQNDKSNRKAMTRNWINQKAKMIRPAALISVNFVPSCISHGVKLCVQRYPLERNMYNIYLLQCSVISSCGHL